jgi:hypothetical protein
MNRVAAFLVLGIMVASGCHKRPRAPVVAPPAPVPNLTVSHSTVPKIPVPEPTPLPPVATPAPTPPDVVVPPPNPLEQADKAFDAGNYPEAARGYEAYLQREPSGDLRDHALFHLALSCAMPSNPNPDWTKMAAVLKQLVDQYPGSPFKPAAAVILAINADNQKRELRIRQLSTELDKLKQIDAERRKRP